MDENLTSARLYMTIIPAFMVIFHFPSILKDANHTINVHAFEDYLMNILI